jgi:hypothetical protein
MTEPKMAGVMPWMAGWLAAEGLPLDIAKFRRYQVECSGGRQR